MISRFEALLENVEALPEEDQIALIDVIRHRLAARRRAEIAANIAETRAEYCAGQVQRGSVDELLSEMDT